MINVNLIINKSSELEKNYLWIGCNKKYIKLRPSETKVIKFKLGFITNGVFEIGKISDENAVKMRLLDATSLTSFDDLMDAEVKNDKIGSTESAAISVYLKNDSNQRYELLKRLKPFTVIVDT